MVASYCPQMACCPYAKKDVCVSFSLRIWIFCVCLTVACQAIEESVESAPARPHFAAALPDSMRGARLTQRGGALLKADRLRMALSALVRTANLAPNLAQTHFFIRIAHARLDEDDLALLLWSRSCY